MVRQLFIAMNKIIFARAAVTPLKLNTCRHIRKIASSFPSVCPQGTTLLPPGGFFFMKFGVWAFFENLQRKFSFLMFIGPCIILIVEQRQTNLMSLALLFHYLMLNLFRMLVHPSSGACDLFVELFHGLYCSGSMCVGVTLWYGWGVVVSGCRLKLQCFILHPDTIPG